MNPSYRWAKLVPKSPVGLVECIATLYVHYVTHRFGSNKQITVHSASSDNANEHVREALYRAYNYPSEAQTKILDDLLSSRDELAKLVGFSSYAGNF